MDDRREAGEITNRHFADYKRPCKAVVDHFGRRAVVAGLKAANSAALRKSFPQTWGPTNIGTEVQRMPTAFRWAAESEVICTAKLRP